MAWKKVSNVAQYGLAAKEKVWPNQVLRKKVDSVEEAMKIADKDQRINFFFFMRQPMLLTAGEGCEAKGQFEPNEAVFFGGKWWWGSAPQADGYIWEPDK